MKVLLAGERLHFLIDVILLGETRQRLFSVGLTQL